MSGRATQLDGWRGVAMIGVVWFHWAPKAWKGEYPFEIGLFFFFTLTGYLITRGLMRERDRAEARGGAWRLAGWWSFQVRRGLRILPPYYAAVALAWVVRADDVVDHPLWYLAHLTNFHIEAIGRWPPGTSQFWTLAVQQQFYLVWPLVVWGVPRRWLGPVFLVLAALAPAVRAAQTGPMHLAPWMELDYLAGGSWLAWWLARGGNPSSTALRGIGWLAGCGYAFLYARANWWSPVPGVSWLQQPLLALACMVLIARTEAGCCGVVGSWLDRPLLQYLGKISYSLFLLHNLAPMLLGHLLPWLWLPWFETGPGLAIRLACFAVAAWALGAASWRWLESPMDRIRKHPG